MDPSGHVDEPTDRRDGRAARWRAAGALAAVWLGLGAARCVADVAGEESGPLAALAWRALSPVPWLAAALGVLAIAGVLRGRGVTLTLAGALALVAGAWWMARAEHVRPDSLAALVAGDESAASGAGIVRVRGVVVAPPREEPDERNAVETHLRAPARAMFELRLREVLGGGGPVRASGTLEVSVLAERVPAWLRAGDAVEVLGVYAPVRAALNPGASDAVARATVEGRVGSLRCEGGEAITAWVTDSNGGGTSQGVESGWRATLAARWALRERMLGLLGAPAVDRAGAVVLALLLGERSEHLGPTRLAMQRTGAVHLLAISGFHIMACAVVVSWLVRLTGEHGPMESLLSVAAVVVYAAVLPAESPVWRSVLLVVSLAGARALGRRYDALAVLGWVGVAWLGIKPTDAASPGFQLTFLISGLLLWLGHARPVWVYGLPRLGLGTRGIDGSKWRNAGEMMADAWRLRVRPMVMTSVACAAVATPVVAWHFGTLTVLAVPASLLLTPVVAAAIGLGVLTAALALPVSIVSAEAAAVIATPGVWALRAMAEVTAWASSALEQLPLAWGTIGAFPLAAALAASAAAWWLVAAGERSGQLSSGAPRGARWLALLMSWGAAGAMGLMPRSLAGGVALRVDMLAVGDGACVLLRSGDAAVLWDCGSLMPGVGRGLVPRALRALGVDGLDAAIVTHANIDHFSGYPDLFEPLGVGTLIVGPTVSERAEAVPDGPEAALLAAAESTGVRIEVGRAGLRLRWDGPALEFVGPPGGTDARGWGTNDRSLVALVRVPTDQGERGLLLTGDIQRAGIAALMSELSDGLEPLRIVAIELPHHGSFNEVSAGLVAWASGAVVLQSTGPRRVNDARWAAARDGRAWLTTASDGAAWVEVLKDGSVRHGAVRRR